MESTSGTEEERAVDSDDGLASRNMSKHGGSSLN